ncbi:hypothetical protein [Acidovorax sp. FG27]|uniref:hypothetical protein n=1 Tax=Acidovorax sp. FG27 TaxID=3133652 RepID=UPI0030EAD540
MIAANYRKFPEAMALQLVLNFGRVLVWALPRPTTRVLRAIRAERARAFKAAGMVRYPEAKRTPAWVKEAARKARELAAAVRQSCGSLGLAFSCDTSTMNAFKARMVEMRMHKWSSM